MERRSALITLAGAVAGLVSLPAWASGWSAETTRPTRTLLSAAQSDLLADIVETIIPKTDTPGAKELNVHQFIEKVVADCSDKATQDTFAKGLTAVNDQARKAGKDFGDLDPAQRMALLTQMSQSTEPAQKDFYGLVKNMTIRGYMTSEYVMTNLTNFQFIPGHYYGCVPVVAKGVSQPKQGK
ncbi:gluconate 2-dehydrogenase subunit 3 family protein [Spirosoma rigui]|uniref:gluconate 2-dehydrogenase subunit 3 family protein n=1 Tax=Spirosoma rigui TaxID=564064 RepID=UPI0009AFA248|nr:gluconate 2-dehydrogenase subunit 3 family protein [Spirosoma rigui]